MIKRIAIAIWLSFPVLLVFATAVYFLFSINGVFDLNPYTALGWVILCYTVYKVGQYSRPEAIEAAFSAPPPHQNRSNRNNDDDDSDHQRNFSLYGSGYPLNDINAPED